MQASPRAPSTRNNHDDLPPTATCMSDASPDLPTKRRQVASARSLGFQPQTCLHHGTKFSDVVSCRDRTQKTLVVGGKTNRTEKLKTGFAGSGGVLPNGHSPTRNRSSRTGTSSIRKQSPTGKFRGWTCRSGLERRVGSHFVKIFQRVRFGWAPMPGLITTINEYLCTQGIWKH